MTEKEIRRLSRRDLLILLAEQTTHANQLEEKLQKKEDEIKELHIAMDELKNRELAISECGSMADAFLKLNQVFENADKAAEQFMLNAKSLSEKQIATSREREEASIQKSKELIRQAEETFEAETKRTNEMVRQAEEKVAEETKKAEAIITQTEEKSAEMIRQAEEKSAEIIRQAEEKSAQEIAKIDEYWEKVYARVCKMEKEYIWLRGIINEKNGER